MKGAFVGKLAGATLWLNVKTRPAKKSRRPDFHKGYVRVELLDEGGKPIPGFAREDCHAISGDHRAVQVTWAGGSKAPAEARRAKFYLRRAFLYGFEFRGLPDRQTSGRIELRPFEWTDGPYTRQRGCYRETKHSTLPSVVGMNSRPPAAAMPSKTGKVSSLYSASF